jgi:guanylate kinase
MKDIEMDIILAMKDGNNMPVSEIADAMTNGTKTNKQQHRAKIRYILDTLEAGDLIIKDKVNRRIVYRLSPNMEVLEGKLETRDKQGNAIHTDEVGTVLRYIDEDSELYVKILGK